MAELTAKPKQQSAPNAEITIKFGESITIDGVTDLGETGDKLVVATLGATHTLTLTGENLKLDLLDVNTQKAMIRGEITSLKYSKGHEKLSFVKRIFK